MRNAAPDAGLRIGIDAASAEARQPLSRAEVAEIVASVLHSIDGDISAVDLKLYAELEALARYIQHARQEIASIRPDDMAARIPTATDELDAVVGATEDATHRIMDSCETIQAVASRLDPESGAVLVAAVTRIFEACNFQDITGQRITKVVRTLKHIERKIETLVEALGEEVYKGSPAAERATDIDPGNERHLLNGPQLPASAIDQSEIDRLLSGH